MSERTALFARKLFLFLATSLVFSFYLQSLLSRPIEVSADNTPSSWLASEPPSLKNLKENIDFSEIPSRVDGNQECLVKQKFTVIRAKLVPYQSEQSFSACGVDTNYGNVDKHIGDLVRTGTSIAGPVYDSYGFKLRILPVPNSNTLITYDINAPEGAYLTLQRNVSTHLKTIADPISGEVKHVLDTSGGQTVRDNLSHRVYARMDTIAFSGDGKWAVFDYPYVGPTRLNIETGEITVFAPGYRYDIGIDPLLNMAISSDGRYAAVSSYSYSTFRIYDLNTCIEHGSNQPEACQYRDLKSVIKNISPDQIGTPGQISFTDDYTLKFYDNILKNGSRRHDVQLLSASGHAPVEFAYLALGDSFASGEGARDYKTGTDVKNPKNKCHISVNSYPYLIGTRLNLNSYESVACSGAKIKDVNGQFLNDYSNNKNGKQADGKEKSIYSARVFDNFLPGYRMQQEFVTKYLPSKITISMSGNDMGFGKVIRNCVFWDNDCYSRAPDRAVLVKTINDRFDELVKMYQQLKQPVDSDVYVIGYPKLVSPDGSCALNVHASHNELIFFDNLVDYIDSVIKKAADSAGVYYVDVSDALVGHRLCESDVAEMAMNGLTAGNDKVFDIGPIGNESYHPDALGHELLEKAILEKTNNFGVRNPAPQEISPPKISDADGFIESAEFNDLNTRFFDSSDSSDGWWYKTERKNIEQSGFAPNSRVDATFTSDPLDLGNFQSDSDGIVKAGLDLPESAPVGYHTLHLSGEDMAGENIEYQKEIFVAYSANDYDGDSIPNDRDPCLAISPSGVDYDQDGVDDVCDEQIGQPPAIPTVLSDVILLPGFDPSPGTSETDIINSVDSSSQNLIYAAPQQGANGLQSQGAVIPQTSINTPIENSGGSLFGGNAGTASLLNQTQVLGASTAEPASVNTVPATTEPSGHISTAWIVIAAVILIVLAVLFRWRDFKTSKEL